MYAAREGNLAIIKFMKKRFVLSEAQNSSQKQILNYEAKSKDGWTAFMYAAVNGYQLTTEFLANECICEVQVIDRMKRNSLHWAARFNNSKMVYLLI